MCAVDYRAKCPLAEGQPTVTTKIAPSIYLLGVMHVKFRFSQGIRAPSLKFSVIISHWFLSPPSDTTWKMEQALGQ